MTNTFQTYASIFTAYIVDIYRPYYQQNRHFDGIICAQVYVYSRKAAVQNKIQYIYFPIPLFVHIE